MGLDLYLTKKSHFGGYGEEDSVEVSVKESRKKYGEYKTETCEKTIKVQGKTIAVSQNVAYWRKANQIHQWFVDNVLGGDEERYSGYCDIENIKELLAVCKEVKKSCKTIKGKIGYGGGITSIAGEDEVYTLIEITDEDGETQAAEITGTKPASELKVGDAFITKTEEDGGARYWNIVSEITAKENNNYQVSYKSYVIGRVIKDNKKARELLPTMAGFFFGSTDYDEWYLSGIEETIEQLEAVVADYEEDVANGTRPYDIEYEYSCSW